MTNNDKGFLGESYVYNKLKEIDPNVKWALLNCRSSYDFILSNGKTIDVKYSANQIVRTNKTKKEYNYWTFNFHHHGVKQIKIDFFICIIQIKKEKSIYIFPSEISNIYSFSISEREIERGKFDYFKNNWDLLKLDKT